MDGIILYADNNVFEKNSFENDLFEKLHSDQELSVLPISNLEDLKKTIHSISTFKALILDWNFDLDNAEDDFEDLGVEKTNLNPESLLESIEVYSLIYVYSQNEIAKEIQDKLTNRFHEKIKFKTKGDKTNSGNEYRTIKKDIIDFENNNKQMEIPFVWSQTINQSVQKIFNELENANSYWIKEIRDTAKEEGSEPTSEVIDIFNNLLSESLIQDKKLRDSLNEYNCDENSDDDESIAKLYRRIYYSKLTENAPIMTGDIFKFEENEYGILITPECEVSETDNLCFLILQETEFDSYLNKNNSYSRGLDDYNTFKEKKKENIRKIFNNEEFSVHILPTFPFKETQYNLSGIVLFKKAFCIKEKNDVRNCRTNYKLNAPYIHQLRQRFVAFFGKYGVPAIPQSLRDFNLK